MSHFSDTLGPWTGVDFDANASTDPSSAELGHGGVESFDMGDGNHVLALDSDGDGDFESVASDLDGDGSPDLVQSDVDGDGVLETLDFPGLDV